MPSYDYKCTTCEQKFIEVVKYDQREDKQLCPDCGTSTGVYCISAPNITRASYVDGTKRKGFSEMKEAAKLNREAAHSGTEKRREIEKEIRRMGVKVSKEII